MDIQTGNPFYVWLTIVVIVGGIVSVWSVFARRRARRMFSTLPISDAVSSRGNFRHGGSVVLMGGSLLLLMLALLDLRWGNTFREIPQKGIEVIFVLDVSRSMLAEDATPNRLTRAKQQIKDLLEEMAGDRVGLVAFAGEARQVVPLTSHYEDFKQTLDLVGPHSVPTGGSRLGEAINVATNGFMNKTVDHKAIMIFTDGEDQESQPVAIAKKLHADQGIRIFTVGLGDMDQGARIPLTDPEQRGKFVIHEGEQVWSRMNGQILRQIATESNGAYIPAGTKRVNMADVYHGYLANVEQQEFETAKINAYIPRFQWFAIPALLLMLIEVLWSTRRLVVAAGNREKGKSLAAAIALVVLSRPIAAQESSLPETFAEQVNAANELVRKGAIEAALTRYQQVNPENQDRELLDFNMAVAHFRNGDLATAENLFAQTAGASDRQLAADSRFNLGNCKYTNALQIAQQDRNAAIKLLRQSIEHYRSSLRIDSKHGDARANIELAVELIRQLEQQQEDQQQEQSQDQEQQQDEEQQQQDEEQQQQSEEQQQQDEEQQQGDEQEQQQGDGEQQEQQGSEQQQQQGGEQQEQGSPQQAGEESQSQNQQSGEEEEARDKSPAEQQVPTGDLSEAGKEDKQPAQGAEKAEADEDQGRLMTKEEALKLLQSVRDRDMLRRLRQEQIQRSRRTRVERDW